MNPSFAFVMCLLCMGSQLANSRYVYPPEQPWGDPCGGSNVVPGTEGQGGTSGTVNVTDALSLIATSAAEARSYARRLRLKYNNVSDPMIRISTNTAKDLQKVPITRLTNLPFVRANSSNIEEALQRDYDDVSTIVVFMENVHLNERTSSASVKYTLEMEDFETSLYHTLCKIKMAADAIPHNLDVNITYDVMDSAYMNLPITTFRHMRDFIVFRDSESYLEGLSAGY